VYVRKPVIRELELQLIRYRALDMNTMLEDNEEFQSFPEELIQGLLRSEESRTIRLVH